MDVFLGIAIDRNALTILADPAHNSPWNNAYSPLR
jgi:hypothetical protein